VRLRYERARSYLRECVLKERYTTFASAMQQN